MIWKDGGKFFGIWRAWKDLEGFGGILKGGMISGDFFRYLTPLVSIGIVFIFRKVEMHCHVGKAHSKQSHVKHGRGHSHGAYHFFVLEPV